MPNKMNLARLFALTFMCCFIVFVFSLSTAASDYTIEPRDLPIEGQWSGNYPVSALDSLPEGQRSSVVGYINNRTSIIKFTLEKGVAEIIAMATLTAMPIEDRVAMSLAVIPRQGVHFIQVGDEHIPVQNP